MTRVPARSDRGFTLIEVLIALVILAISLGVVLRIFSQNLVRASETEDEAVADSLAESMVDSVGRMDPIVDGDTAGRFTNGFTWRLHIAPYGPSRNSIALPLGAHEVIAEVDWVNDGRARSEKIETLRLAPKGSAP